MNKCCRNNLANNIPDRNKQCLYNVEIAFVFHNKFETFASCKKLLLKTIQSKLYYSTNGSLVFDLILLIIKLIQFYFDFQILISLQYQDALLYCQTLTDLNSLREPNLVLPVRIGLRERQYTPQLYAQSKT